ncbi:HAMP domain-containing histidine kinase [bacterium]|nr:HAMP domain-containing histidine kinase [bacterium]
MKVISSDNLTEKITKLISTEISTNDFGVFFDELKNVISFRNYYVFLLNSEDIQFKTSNNKENFEFEETFDISYNLAKQLFAPKCNILNKNDELIKLLKLSQNNYIISKLSIKNTIFGFVLFENDTKYTEQDLINAEAISSILSYKIKDLELSEVFKIQLKALKNAVQETNNAYKTIKIQNKKILAADKVKNEFLASVSHELRTPLNAIIGFSDILKAQVYGKLNEKQTEYINDIQVSGIQLLGMVNEILDITKIEANAIKLVKRYFEISRPVIETTNLLMPLIKNKNIDIKYSIQNDIDIYADYQKIQQIMYNLLSNAIKYTPENGKINISVTNTKKNVKITVQDTGIGIDKKYHKKIFQKFVQLEDAFYKKETSTGLGLTITKQLTEMHGGKIKVESEKGCGASFIVTLPIELPDEPQV